MKSLWGSEQTQFFFELTPERVLRAVEALGFVCTGRVLQLNSFENRVYEVEIDIEDDAIPAKSTERAKVVKFFRPGRWTREQILDEHEFMKDLTAQEVPAIAPIQNEKGETLFLDADSHLLYTVFPKYRGRAPDELSFDDFTQIGRLQARIHQVGALKKAEHRVVLNADTYGTSNLEFLLANEWVEPSYRSRYETAARNIIARAQETLPSFAVQRIHGDCHLGNLLNDQGRFSFLDFDDMVMGPTVQDCWLLFPEADFRHSEEFQAYLEGYESMSSFNIQSLNLVPVLRGLRLIHYAAWIARRFKDPAFTKTFAHIKTAKYWEDQVFGLEALV